MNERIQKLAEQARDWGYAEHSGYTAQLLFEHKFAELIVKECLSIAQQEHKNALEFEWDNDDTAQTIRDSISKHFGVEE